MTISGLSIPFLSAKWHPINCLFQKPAQEYGRQARTQDDEDEEDDGRRKEGSHDQGAERPPVPADRR